MSCCCTSADCCKDERPVESLPDLLYVNLPAGLLTALDNGPISIPLTQYAPGYYQAVNSVDVLCDDIVIGAEGQPPFFYCGYEYTISVWHNVHGRANCPRGNLIIVNPGTEQVDDTMSCGGEGGGGHDGNPCNCIARPFFAPCSRPIDCSCVGPWTGYYTEGDCVANFCSYLSVLVRSYDLMTCADYETHLSYGRLHNNPFIGYGGVSGGGGIPHGFPIYQDSNGEERFTNFVPGVATSCDPIHINYTIPDGLCWDTSLPPWSATGDGIPGKGPDAVAWCPNGIGKVITLTETPTYSFPDCPEGPSSSSSSSSSSSGTPCVDCDELCPGGQGICFNFDVQPIAIDPSCCGSIWDTHVLVPQGGCVWSQEEIANCLQVDGQPCTYSGGWIIYLATEVDEEGNCETFWRLTLDAQGDDSECIPDYRAALDQFDCQSGFSHFNFIGYINNTGECCCGAFPLFIDVEPCPTMAMAEAEQKAKKAKRTPVNLARENRLSRRQRSTNLRKAGCGKCRQKN